MRLRASEGLFGVDYFFPGYAVWAKLIEAAADLGYDTNNLVRARGCSGGVHSQSMPRKVQREYGCDPCANNRHTDISGIRWVCIQLYLCSSNEKIRQMRVRIKVLATT